MKKKVMAVLAATILVMSSTPVFAASGSNCPLNSSTLGNRFSNSRITSCSNGVSDYSSNNLLTNLKSNSNLNKSYLTSGSNCAASDLLNSYFGGSKGNASKGNNCFGNVCFDTSCLGNDCTGADCADKDCTGADCTAKDCTGADCAAKDCTGADCAAKDCTGADCTAKDCTGADCTAKDCTGADCTAKDCTGADCTADKGSANNGSNSNNNGSANNGSGSTNNKVDTNVSESAYVSEVVRLVNIERAKEGLGALSTNGTIQSAAQTRAEEIVSTFSHTRPNGSSCFTALDAAGVKYSGAGENIAYGQPTPAAVVDAWMNSPGHRANIMKANFTTIGVGCYNSGGTYYWSQFFTY